MRDRVACVQRGIDGVQREAGIRGFSVAQTGFDSPSPVAWQLEYEYLLRREKTDEEIGLIADRIFASCLCLLCEQMPGLTRRGKRSKK
jgi:hypothetical protein